MTMTFEQRVEQCAKGLKEATGLGATHVVGSDRYAYSVVKVTKSPSGKTTYFHLQPDVAVLKSGDILSEAQNYAYFADPSAPITVLKRTERPRKRGDGWYIGERREYRYPSF